jgi:hypothetical protein
LHRGDGEKFTNVSEVLAASIIALMLQPRRQPSSRRRGFLRLKEDHGGKHI